MHLVPLDQELKLDEVGGKALHLSEMIRNSLPVPYAVCIPVKTYHDYVDPISKSFSHEQFEQVRKKIQEIKFDDDLIEELDAYIGKHKPVAVRSSGVMEDMKETSFAGQYDTFLNITELPDLIIAIKKCWASLWSYETLTYIENNIRTNRKMSIAVVLQEQIDPICSGVLFTVNPMTGRDSHFLIESVWGLGEGVVSGEISPDKIIYDWKTKTVVEHTTTKQSEKYVVDEKSGIKKIATSSAEKDTHSISESLLDRIISLGIKIGKYYGYPQDIEWAYAEKKLYLLQTRPLTSIQFDEKFGQWTNANFVEVFPGFHNPLSFSLTGGAFTTTLHEYLINLKIWRNPPKRKEPWHALIFGRTYWKVSGVKKLLAQIPGYNERSFDITTGIPVTYDGDGKTTPWSLGRILWALPVLSAMAREYKRYWKVAKQYKEQFEKRYDSLLSKALNSQNLNTNDLIAFTKELFNLHLEANNIAQYTSFLATQSQDDFHEILNKLNKGEEEKISFSRLFTGLQDVKTARPLTELHKIIHSLRGVPIEKIKALNRENVFESRSMDAEVIPLLNYINEFAWMAENDEDLSCPRWYNDTSIPIELVIKLLEREEMQTYNPDEQKEIRLREEEKAKIKLNKGFRRFNLFLKSSFWKQAELVKKYSWWREETREMLSRIYFIEHLVLDELFSRYEKEGIVDKKDELYSMTYLQLLNYFETRDKKIIHDAVEEYVLVKMLFRNYSPPNTIGSRITTNETLKEDLKGVGCSSGRVSGIVRVLKKISQITEIQEGEIAVVPHTNPGWTPIFSLISGIVMEEGGLLSHGSVVAREYGIPAIIQVKNATTLLKNGEKISIDGTNGVITKLD